MTLALFGAGGHAKSVYDLVKKNKIYLFDEKKKFFQVDKKILNVIGNLKTIKNYKKKNF